MARISVCDWCGSVIDRTPPTTVERVQLPSKPYLTVRVSMQAHPERLDEDDEEEICERCGLEAVKLAVKKLAGVP